MSSTTLHSLCVCGQDFFVSPTIRLLAVGELPISSSHHPDCTTHTHTHTQEQSIRFSTIHRSISVKPFANPNPSHHLTEMDGLCSAYETCEWSIIHPTVCKQHAHRYQEYSRTCIGKQCSENSKQGIHNDFGASDSASEA